MSGDWTFFGRGDEQRDWTPARRHAYRRALAADRAADPADHEFSFDELARAGKWAEACRRHRAARRARLAEQGYQEVTGRDYSGETQSPYGPMRQQRPTGRWWL